MTHRPGPKVEPGLAGGLVRRTITVDDLTWRKLLVLGAGNASKGVRTAANVAFDRYQRSKD